MSWVPAPKPVTSMRMGGKRPEARRHRRHDGGAGGRGELDRQSPGPTSGSRAATGPPPARGWAGTRARCGSCPCPSPPATRLPRRRRGSPSPRRYRPRRSRCHGIRPRGNGPGRAGADGAFPPPRPATANVSRARRVTRGGRRASSTRATMCGMRPHHDVVGRLHHGARGGDAGPQDGLGPKSPTPERQASQQGEQLGEVGAGVEQAAERHVAGDAGEAVEPRHRRRPRVCGVGTSGTEPRVPDSRSRRSRQHAGNGAGGTEAVVDPDHGETRRTRCVHGEQRRDAVERRSVSGRHRHGHDRGCR